MTSRRKGGDRSGGFFVEIPDYQGPGCGLPMQVPRMVIVGGPSRSVSASAAGCESLPRKACAPPSVTKSSAVMLKAVSAKAFWISCSIAGLAASDASSISAYTVAVLPSLVQP